jgi:hypothetical protein
MKFGLERAKLFCRHSTLATTESHYSNFVSEDKLDNPKSLRWLRWATPPPANARTSGTSPCPRPAC